jgi:hypothetical protein
MCTRQGDAYSLAERVFESCKFGAKLQVDGEKETVMRASDGEELSLAEQSSGRLQQGVCVCLRLTFSNCIFRLEDTFLPALGPKAAADATSARIATNRNMARNTVGGLVRADWQSQLFNRKRILMQNRGGAQKPGAGQKSAIRNTLLAK